MTNKQWAIRVNGDTWMSEGYWMDDNGDWQADVALYSTSKEAKKDAAWFSKDSAHVYEAMVYKDS